MTDTEAFLAAVTAGDLDAVGHALAADPSLAARRDASGVSAVLLAAYAGHAAVRDLLARFKGSLDVFEAAAVGDDTRLAAVLADEPESARSCAPDGFTPAALAAFFGRLPCLRALLDAGADPNTPAANAMRVTVLHAAAAHRDPETALEMVRLLLDRGARLERDGPRLARSRRGSERRCRRRQHAGDGRGEGRP